MLTARDIFAIFVAAAGWHYLFLSSAARRLQAVERGANHRVRVLLRRFNGLMIIAMAILFFAGSQPWMERKPVAFIGVWFAVIVLLFLIIMGALVDIRLTMKRRTEHRRMVKPTDDQP